MIGEHEWDVNLDAAEAMVGETKDAPIMAAYLLDEVDVLVTSNTQDFPHDDYDSIVTPRGFLERFVSSAAGG